MKDIPLLLGIIIFWTACGTSNTPPSKPEANAAADTLPPGAIPMQYNGKHLYLTAILNDSIPATLVFETGADRLYLDSTWFNGSGIKTSKLARGFVGRTSIRMITDTVSCRLDTIERRFDNIALIPLREIVREDCGGLLGNNFFDDRMLIVDYDRQYIRPVQNDSTVLDGYTMIPMSFEGNRYYIDTEIVLTDGRKIGEKALIDLGNPNSLHVSQQSTARYNLNKSATESNTSEALHLSGEGSVHDLQVPELRIGPFTFRNTFVTCSVLFRKDKRLSSSALIGNGLLSRFSLVIDYPNKRLYLKPGNRFDDIFALRHKIAPDTVPATADSLKSGKKITNKRNNV